MNRSILALLLLTLSASAFAQAPISAAWVDKSPHKEGVVTANGVKLHYLEWGGAAVLFGHEHLGQLAAARD